MLINHISSSSSNLHKLHNKAKKMLLFKKYFKQTKYFSGTVLFSDSVNNIIILSFERSVNVDTTYIIQMLCFS